MGFFSKKKAPLRQAVIPLSRYFFVKATGRGEPTNWEISCCWKIPNHLECSYALDLIQDPTPATEKQRDVAAFKALLMRLSLTEDWVFIQRQNGQDVIITLETPVRGEQESGRFREMYNQAIRLSNIPLVGYPG
jgi:hypothetical protein